MVRIPSGTAFSSQPASQRYFFACVYHTKFLYFLFSSLSRVCVCVSVFVRAFVCWIITSFFFFLFCAKNCAAAAEFNCATTKLDQHLQYGHFFSGLEGRIRRGKRNRRVIFPEGLMEVVRVVGGTGFRDGGFEALYLAFNGGIRLSLPSVWGANQIGSANMARRTLPERLAVHQHPTSRGTLGGLDSITANQPVEQKHSFSSNLGAVPKDFAHCFDRFPPQSHFRHQQLVPDCYRTAHAHTPSERQTKTPK